MFRFSLVRQDEIEVSAYRTRPELNFESDRDLARRSIIGVSAYFLLWLLIYYTTGLEEANDTLLEFMGFMLAATGVGRLYLALNFNELYTDNPRLWRGMFAAGTLLAAAIWGGVTALALDYDGLGPTAVMVMLSAAGLTAIGIVSLAPSVWLGAVFVLFMLLPVVPFAWGSGGASERGVALLFLSYFVFMLFLWRRLYLEYWQALAARAELVIAKEAAEAATLAKGQFIASVSHELRTPLTAIIGALGLIESDLPDGIPPHAMKLIDMAYKNGKQLSLLINDLLDFEKLSAGRMEFHCKPVALIPFLEHAIEMNHAYAESHDVSLALVQPVPALELNADEQRLLQVMANLLSNAVKYSPAGESVRISAELKDGGVRISIIDRGPGVPESFRSQIFGKFAQADNSNTRKTSGTGLGLAISKGIVEGLGGVIGFDSSPGAGATFYFELPLVNPGKGV